MSTTNPMDKSSVDENPVSRKIFHLAGILVTVHGLDEVPDGITELACLWLLHPRLRTQDDMAPVAGQAIRAWNVRLREDRAGAGRSTGLIAVAFDQRNHGSRLVDPLANEAWRAGNERHAQDMFSIYHGTALDTSLLITHLPSYLFPDLSCPINTHVVLGVSLGGHAAWQCLFSDPRLRAGVVVIGCPDYVRLMEHRAEKSKRKTWTQTDPPGAGFVGSADFPPALVEAVSQHDPKGLFERWLREQRDANTKSAQNCVKEALARKRVLNLAGSVDKLVPYKCSEPFLRILDSSERMTEDGYTLENVVFDGVGHQFTPEMADRAVTFICDTLAHQGKAETSGVGSSKI